MEDNHMNQDEQQRRVLQEYIFNLETTREEVEELAAAHARLKESQDLLVAVLDSTSHGICLIRNHIFVWCNRGFSHILGWEQEELAGLSAGILHPAGEKDNAVRTILNDASRKGGLVTRECNLLHKNGHPVPCLVNVRPQDENEPSRGCVLSITNFTELKNAQMELQTAYRELEARTTDLVLTNAQLSKEIVGHREARERLSRYRNHLEDLVKQRTEELKKTNEYLRREISERKQQEETLQELEELESSILGAISHAVIGLKNRIVIFASDAVEDVFGWRPDELIGKNTRLFHATDEEYERIELMYDVLAKQKLYSAELPCRHKDGRDIMCRLTASRIGPSLTDRQIVVTLEDITQRQRVENALRESEEKYRNIYENTFEGIFQATPDGRMLSSNPALAHLYKAASPDEFMREVEDLGALWADPVRRNEFWRALEDQGIVQNFVAQIGCKDGDRKWVSVNARSVLDKEGRPLYCEGTFQDISEHKRLESQLVHSQKMQAIGTLAGGVAHDINNILMGIQGYASLMLYDPDRSHSDRERLSRVEELVRSGADLARQLLGFAREGKYEVHPIRVNETIKETSTMFGRTKKEITIHLSFQEDLLAVDADRGQIEQVLVNLYVNAWHAMPGGGALFLATENTFVDTHQAKACSVSPGRYVKISVTDTGTGMDGKTRERIFEPFFTTKEMGRGTGLGLASVYGIIKNHGGFINVYSEKGHGSTFTVYLPASLKMPLEEKPPQVHIQGGKETILVVDDEPTIARVCKGLLEVLGYSVITATNGREAVDIYQAQKGSIQLVVLDMIMPDIGGEETFEFLKLANPDVKVILSSGYSMNSQATRIMNQGCRAFIQKPFSMQELSEKIRRVLDA